MKTVRQYLKDEIHYPVSDGFIENRLIARGIEPDAVMSMEVASMPFFQGALADCLYSLLIAPNFSESDISISLTDKELLLKRANLIYGSIGEEAKTISGPKVYIGG